MSFFAERCKTQIYSVGCRSPPANLDFFKNSDWRKPICHSIMATRIWSSMSGSGTVSVIVYFIYKLPNTLGCFFS